MVDYIPSSADSRGSRPSWTPDEYSFKNLAKVTPGNPNDCDVATVTYYRHVEAADALAKQLFSTSNSRKVSEPWKNLSSDDKCSFIANGLGIASGSAGIAGLALGGRNSANNLFTMKVSLKNESNAVIVPFIIGASEVDPNRTWAWTREAPTIILPGEETYLDMEKDFWYPYHFFKLHLQVKSLNPNIQKTVGITLYIQHWMQNDNVTNNIFSLGGIEIINPDNDHFYELGAPTRADYSIYALNYWKVIGKTGYGGFPSIGIASLETRARVEASETATLQINFVKI